VAYNQAQKSGEAGGNGGGFYVFGGDVEMRSGTITKNAADVNGGGFYVTGGQVEIKGGTISNNVAEANGGGFYVDVSDASIETKINSTVANTTISHNKAVNGGGAYVNQGTLKIEDAATSIVADTATVSGGGIYMNTGTVTVTNAKVEGNVAKTAEGGGIYVGNGGSKATSSITLNGATVDGNEAATSGGGIYVAGNVTLQNGALVKRNEAEASGGGIYVADGGTFTMTGGTVGGTTAEGNKATGANGAGGGLFMAGGTATISGGDISGNSATMNGGGIFMDGRETGVAATCTLSNNASIGGMSENYANNAQYGGGICSMGGTITVKGGTIEHNIASLDGGGIYSAGAKAKIYIQKEGTTLSHLQYNKADRNGGGVFSGLGEIYFTDGNVQYNFAKNAGGGMYVDADASHPDSLYGTLYLRGNANIYRNHVPEGHDGGGVYLKGVVEVGEQVSAPSLLGRIRVQENYAGESYQYTGTDTINNLTANNRNNIYLPLPDTVHSSNTSRPHRDVITVIEGGINTSTTRVGFSVEHGNVPVIYCAYSPTSRNYLHQFSTGQSNQYSVFDDSRKYIAVQYSNQPDIFDPDHVYLYGFWTNEVTGSVDDEYCYVNPAKFDSIRMNISKPCELAFFISWVNGLNEQGAHPTDSARLVDDIDMRAFGWVPIDNYQGLFDGNGHTVSGIVSMLNTEHTEYGFFGNLNGGTVKDLYIKGASYSIEARDDHQQLYIGGIAGRMDGGTIQNCEASSAMHSDDPNTVMGGLVGRMDSGKVHSSIGIPSMTGNLMGGLVGELVGDSLVNSFANAKFTSESNAKYQGGLVAVNGGLVENCYFHEQEGSNHGALFGTLVGNNTDSVKYCYAGSQKVSPYGTPSAPYTVQGKSPKGHGYYADNTETPYLYRRRDNQVTLEVENSNPYIPAEYGDDDNPLLKPYGSDEQMLHYLNNWVDTLNKKQSVVNYTKWARPTTKAINDDLPLLLMPHDSINAVAATTGDPYLEYGTVNSRIESFRTSQQAIYMYRTQTDSVVGNGGSDAGLYIDEHVALIQKGELKAHVGITLDNSAGINGAQPTFGGTAGEPSTDYTDWHFFATPLVEVPLGINYKDDETQWHGAMNNYDYYNHYGPYYQFFDNPYEEGEENSRGYFPSHAYGTTYSDDNSGLTTGGNYYKEWDFYTYYEPEYHWINFKRNGNDHWHENAPDAQIEYRPYGPEGDIMNETFLIPGKGYMVATREPNTFLQAQGILNGEDFNYPVTRQGYYSTGYNLLGNPYQAYLDFEEFANDNAALWDGATPSYYVIDEDKKDYVAYARQGSSNPARPGQLIHPHQGFMILLNSGNGGNARFSTTMRNTQGTEGFRSSQPAYPLVNLFATERNGNSSMVTVELGRPDKGGAAVLRDMHVSRGKLYCRYEGEDYEIAFTQPGLTEAAIRFETLEDADYTMTWNTHNGEFSYLHLIDNLTGADVDCLAESEYRFTSKTTDYKSRFRLVFGYTGIDEPGDDGTSTGSAATSSFAFQMGDQLVVNGEGTLQVFDMAGRQVMSTETHGTQTTVSLPGMAAGVYTMRLTNTRSTQVQKIVIR
jgi:predicted outer membrane repeat protein